METIAADNWESAVVSPQTVTGKIKPGMSIFLGTAGAEPRTMVRHLMTAESKNLEDLELIQLVSFGDAISLQTLQSQKFSANASDQTKTGSCAIGVASAVVPPCFIRKSFRLIRA